MKHLAKRTLAMLLAFVLCFSILSGLSVTADAATYTANWGTRGVTATSLSASAEAFYGETTYDDLAASSDLYSTLQTLMVDSHHTITSYGGTTEMFAYTDCQNSDTTSISSFYSGKAIGPDWDSGATWNREHTWPQSKGLDGSDENDIMMLRPTASSENSSRGNKAYGESSGYFDPNTVSGGTYNLHGDVARIMLYVYVRWGNTGNMWGTDGVMESKEVLLKWMEEDPVDTWELGRNDSVQSITGTRNVFVDYPELAFLLFGEEIPTDMTTPSGEAVNSAGYTITAVSNDEAYGTVSVSGNIISATPADGYQVSGYEILSGEATVTQNGNIFTVSTSADCTVRISFEELIDPIVTFVVPLEVEAVENQQCGTNGIILPSADVPTGEHEYTFVGWSTETVTDSEVAPTLYEAGSTYTTDTDVTLYAVYSYIVGGTSGTTYKLVTNESQLTIGATVVITAADYDYALSTTQNSNNRGQAEISKNTENSTIEINSNVEELTLGAGTSAGTYSFYDSSDGYLYCASTLNKNYLKTKPTLDEKGSFTITVNNDGTCTITSKTTTSDRNILKYNDSNDLFACYKSGQKDVSLYVKSVDGTTYYTTGNTCSHETTEVRGQVGATCTTDGYTGDTYCTGCGELIATGEAIPATGHADAAYVAEVPSTCKTNGIKAHYHCDACGKDYLEKSADAAAQSAEDLKLALDATNHEGGTTVKGKADATCTADGYTGDTYCTGCGELIASGEAIPALSHKLKKVSETPATHDADGNITYYVCTECGKIFADAKAEKELTKAETVIPKGEHDYSDAYETDEDGHWKSCDCGSKTDEGAHTYGKWTTVKEPDVGVAGSKERTCSECGYKQTETIPATAAPVTGDESPVMLWLALLLVSACGLCAAIVVLTVKKKRS